MLVYTLAKFEVTKGEHTFVQHVICETELTPEDYEFRIHPIEVEKIQSYIRNFWGVDPEGEAYGKWDELFQLCNFSYLDNMLAEMKNIQQLTDVAALRLKELGIAFDAADAW